jgi:hypothetical protein
MNEDSIGDVSIISPSINHQLSEADIRHPNVALAYQLKNQI